MFSAIFIDRPRFAIVIAILIALAGAIAITAIPIAQFPDIVPPQVTLTANYPGADAEVVENTVAQQIEEQIGVLRQDVERTRELLTRERDHRLKVVLPRRFKVREVRVLPLALEYLIPATAEDTRP